MAAYLSEKNGRIFWGPLVEGTLIKRYNRFLADVRLKNNRRVTAHCPNTGSMKTCSDPGRPVRLSRHDDPKRKLKYTWEIIEYPETLVGINTGVPNRLVKAAARAGRIPEFSGYETFRSEVKIGAGTRLDLLFETPGRRPCYIEIKNCTLVEEGRAFFPDAVTERGRKHLNELARLVEEGSRAVIFYLVQRMDARDFAPADAIDPAYGETLRQVMAAGVEALAYDVAIDQEGIEINRRLNINT